MPTDTKHKIENQHTLYRVPIGDVEHDRDTLPIYKEQVRAIPAGAAVALISHFLPVNVRMHVAVGDRLVMNCADGEDQYDDRMFEVTAIHEQFQGSDRRRVLIVQRI